jgi:hypothetical protein
MGYKPLSAISFSELQSLLSNLTLITMDNEQVYTIDPTGFDFDSGTIKLKDPPPEYALITAHMGDTPIHGDHTALNNYCLKSTATPGAYGLAPVIFPFEAMTNFDLLFKIRIDSAFAEYPGVPFFRIKNQANATRLAVGFEQHTDPVLFISFGEDSWTYEPADSGFFSGIEGQWCQFGFSFQPDTNNPGASRMFCLWDSFTTSFGGGENISPIFPASTTDTIEIGCAGISLGMVSFSSHFAFNLFTPENYTVPPYPILRSAHSLNFYNFRPVTGVTGVKDRAIISTYRTNLTLATGATIETYETI